MKNKFFILAFIIVLLLLPSALATSHYSFEHSEELKPLIDWRDYNPQAFSEAIDQNKPIFLFLTAPSWCYWCQVYESEEYLFHPQMIEILNNEIIPIYVDADQRQDLTRQFLEGGWPSTTILTPGRDRLFGYSGVRPVQNMLINLREAINYVNQNKFSNEVFYNYQKTTPFIPNEIQVTNFINSHVSHLLQSYDSVNGGFGGGQKFPQGRSLDFSLELYEQTGNKQFLDLVENTLINQYTSIEEIETNYNLFDPVEGGFHRYGTRRDWTPPHYEKMLYDNARLLRAYSHLLEISPDNAIAREVVDKTQTYIETNWYDSREGGFYGNTDVHGEEEYYGKFPRSANKPRVEKTKYSDWNSEAILTYLKLWENTREDKYKDMSTKSLDFFEREMITNQGAYHYNKEDSSKGVTGSLLDNSYLILTFIEGYETLGNTKYLETSRKLADYSLDNLYDWNSGGFFERNSQDKNLYAPGENILLSKPTQENGIIAYALLKLYKQTGEITYLNAGLKTFGATFRSSGGLDFGYYHAKTAQFILEENILGEFSQAQNEIKTIEEQKLERFWVNDLAKDTESLTDFVVSEQGLDKLDGPLLILIIVSLFAGFISFISPCTLPILPAYIAYTFESSKKNIKTMTLFFFLGLSSIFVLLGMSATLIGSFLRSQITIFSQVAGIALIFFGLYILLGKGFSGLKIKKSRPTTYFGSFLFGGILGISWTPCVGPILVAILLLASTTSSVLFGGILLLAYAAGLAIPLILFSTYLGKINKEGRLWKIIKGKQLIFKFENKQFTVHSSSLISGLLFIILGYLIFSGILFSFNQYVSSTGFQRIIFAIEEKLLGFVR